MSHFVILRGNGTLCIRALIKGSVTISNFVGNRFATQCQHISQKRTFTMGNDCLHCNIVTRDRFVINAKPSILIKNNDSCGVSCEKKIVKLRSPAVRYYVTLSRNRKQDHSRIHETPNLETNSADIQDYPTPNDEEYGHTGAYARFENEYMVKLTPLQRAIITVGSGLSAFFDPTRAENIATFGEISAGLVLQRLYKGMLEDPEAYRILSQKPRINSKTVDLEYLSKLPEGTFGLAYFNFLRKNSVTPDSRLPVRFIEDPELAYVMQRYREVHDLVHTVTGQPTNMLGEVVVKWIEGIQTGLPMCVTGGLFGATRLHPKQRQRYIDSHLKWAIDVGFTSRPFLYIFYEERWEQSLEELRLYICPKLLSPPPTKPITK